MSLAKAISFSRALIAAGTLSATSEFAAAQAPRETAAIEETVVTAQRIEEAIQDVPLSVAAFTGEELEARDVQRVADLIARIPNVQITGDAHRGANGGAFTIRGIPDVANYVDGVHQFWRAGSIARQVIEVERIEVLRGPQGTLFGKDARGGAIQYITKRPGDELGIRASLTAGDYDRRDLKAVVDVPLSDTVKTKWTAAHLEHDGFVDSLLIDRSFGDVEDDVFRGDVLWQPSDSFQLRFNAEKNRYRANGQPRITTNVHEPQTQLSLAAIYQLAGVPFTNSLYASGFPGGDVGERESKSIYPNDGWKLDEERAVLDLEWNLANNITLEAISGHFEIVDDTSIDHCSCELNLLFIRQIADAKLFSQELRLHGAHGRVRWIAGAYYSAGSVYSREWTWQFKEFRDDPALLATLNSVIPISLPGNSEGGFEGHPDSLAVFGQATVQLGDKSFVTFGLREFEENDEISNLACAPTINDAVVGGDPLGSRYDCAAVETLPLTFSHHTPRASFEYEWNDDLMTYVSYAEGFNSGGINVLHVPGVPEIIPYDPETVETMEIGLRSDWWNRRLRFNVTAFTTAWVDIQVPVFLPDPIPVGILVNAAAAAADGVEIEIVAAPSERWRLDFGLGWLDARYTETGGALSFAVDTPFANAPERSYAVGVQRTVVLRGDASLTARLDFGWVDDHLTMPEASIQVTQEAYGLLSARIGYRFRGSRYQLALFGTNLTDEYYFDSAVTDPSTGYATATLGRPREIGLTVQASFD